MGTAAIHFLQPKKVYGCALSLSVGFAATSPGWERLGAFRFAPQRRGVSLCFFVSLSPIRRGETDLPRRMGMFITYDLMPFFIHKLFVCFVYFFRTNAFPQKQIFVFIKHFSTKSNRLFGNSLLIHIANCIFVCSKSNVWTLFLYTFLFRNAAAL